MSLNNYCCFNLDENSLDNINFDDLVKWDENIFDVSLESVKDRSNDVSTKSYAPGYQKLVNGRYLCDNTPSSDSSNLSTRNHIEHQENNVLRIANSDCKDISTKSDMWVPFTTWTCGSKSNIPIKNNNSSNLLTSCGNRLNAQNSFWENNVNVQEYPQTNDSLCGNSVDLLAKHHNPIEYNKSKVFDNGINMMDVQSDFLDNNNVNTQEHMDASYNLLTDDIGEPSTNNSRIPEKTNTNMTVVLNNTLGIGVLDHCCDPNNPLCTTDSSKSMSLESIVTNHIADKNNTLKDSDDDNIIDSTWYKDFTRKLDEMLETKYTNDNSSSNSKFESPTKKQIADKTIPISSYEYKSLMEILNNKIENSILSHYCDANVPLSKRDLPKSYSLESVEKNNISDENNTSENSNDDSIINCQWYKDFTCKSDKMSETKYTNCNSSNDSNCGPSTRKQIADKTIYTSSYEYNSLIKILGNTAESSILGNYYNANESLHIGDNSLEGYTFESDQVRSFTPEKNDYISKKSKHGNSHNILKSSANKSFIEMDKTPSRENSKDTPNTLSDNNGTNEPFSKPRPPDNCDNIPTNFDIYSDIQRKLLDKSFNILDFLGISDNSPIDDNLESSAKNHILNKIDKTSNVTHCDIKAMDTLNHLSDSNINKETFCKPPDESSNSLNNFNFDSSLAISLIPDKNINMPIHFDINNKDMQNKLLDKSVNVLDLLNMSENLSMGDIFKPPAKNRVIDETNNISNITNYDSSIYYLPDNNAMYKKKPPDKSNSNFESSFDSQKKFDYNSISGMNNHNNLIDRPFSILKFLLKKDRVSYENNKPNNNTNIQNIPNDTSGTSSMEESLDILELLGISDDSSTVDNLESPNNIPCDELNSHNNKDTSDSNNEVQAISKNKAEMKSSISENSSETHFEFNVPKDSDPNDFYRVKWDVPKRDEPVVERNGGTPDGGPYVTPPNMQCDQTDSKDVIEELCPVCGDKVSGYHYGLLTCESCKGFFKRTVQNKKVYTCVAERSCHIDKTQRKRCPFCRFQKCLEVGMKLEAVRADRMRGGRNKFGPMYKRDRARKLQLMRQRQMAAHTLRGEGALPLGGYGAAGSTLNYPAMPIKQEIQIPQVSSLTSSPDSSPSPGALQTAQPQQQLATIPTPQPQPDKGWPGAQSTTRSPVSPEQFGFDSGSASEPGTNAEPLRVSPMIREFVQSIDDREWQNSLFGLLQSQTYNQCEVDLFELMCKVLDQNLFSQVDWARNTAFFKDLKVDDQMKLLQHSWSDMLVLDHLHQRMHNGLPDETTLHNGQKFDLLCLGLLGVPTLAEHFNELQNKLAELKFDVSDYICVKFLLLLNPEVRGITNRKCVQEGYETVQAALLDYTLTCYPNIQDKFSKLVMIVPEIHALAARGEEHLYSRHCAGQAPTQTLLMEMLHAKRK